MKIICAGYGKTGTKSIARALRHLGFTVFDWEEQSFDCVDHWVDVFQNGVKPDVKRVYQNADACTDFPGAFFFEEILDAFPDCKVILSEREEDSWIESLVGQLNAVAAVRSEVVSMLSPTASKMAYVYDSVLNAAYGSCNPNSTHVLRKRYRIHNHRVKSIVPADKLLMYSVTQGWKPLCDFLECEVPTVTFPHENIKSEIANTTMMTRFGQQVNREFRNVVFKIGLFLVVILGVFLAIFWNHRPTPQS